jgi:hypothetical protein
VGAEARPEEEKLRRRHASTCRVIRRTKGRHEGSAAVGCTTVALALRAVEDSGVLSCGWQRRRPLTAPGNASEDDGRRLERERFADSTVGTATTLGEPAAGEGGDDQPDNRDGG